MAFFSFPTCAGVAQLVFRPFSEKIVPRVAVDPVCPWEVSSRILVNCRLEPPPQAARYVPFPPFLSIPKSFIGASLSPARCLEFFVLFL